MPLLKEERELVLAFDEESNEYEVYCSSSKMRTKLDRAGYVAYRVEEDGTGYYKLPVHGVSFRKPTRKTMTEENKEKARERMREMHQKKAESGESN